MALLKNILFVFFLSAHIVAQSQKESDLKLLTTADKFQLQERVLLIPDQNFYLAGETLNFFAMTVDAGLQIPVEFSSILYVEIFDQNNIVVSAKKVLLKHGGATQTMTLPRELKTGYYYIRAYTNYMKNFGPSAFFTQRLKVVNPFYPNDNSTMEEVRSNKMQWGFSTDAANLLQNTENRIVFYNAANREEMSARLYENEIIINQAGTKNGIGSFSFIPTEGNKYRIEAIAASGKSESVELNISSSGIICRLDSIQNNQCFLSVVSKNFTNVPLSLSVENNGITYAYVNSINDTLASFQLRLPAGLNKVVIKDAGQNSVAERLIYIKPQPKLELAARFNKREANRGDSVVLNMHSDISDSIRYIVAVHLGNANTAPSLQELIESMLFNTSASLLTNHIEVHELHGLSNDWKHMNDYLLRFSNKGLAGKQHGGLAYWPEIGHDLVTGRLVTNDSKVSPANKNLYLSFVDSICWLNRGETDSSGRFSVALPVGFQGKSLFINVLDTLNSYTVLCDDEFYPDFLKVEKEDYYPDSSLKSVIEARMINLQVNDAYAEFHKSNKKTERPLLRFYGYPNAEYKFSKYLNLPNLEEFINEIVKEAFVKRRGAQVNFKVITGKNEITNSKPLIIFDGIPILQTHLLSPLISTEKLASIRVVSSRFFFGSEVFDGILDITSNDKSYSLAAKDKNAIQVRFSPVMSESGIVRTTNSRIPRYTSGLYFGKISSVSGKEELKISLPQNSGRYSLNLFGYNKNGEWGCFAVPDILIVK